MFGVLKQYLYTFFAMMGALLAGFAIYQKKRADSKEEKISELEDEMQANDINNEVKNFEAINRERKDIADAKLDEAFDDLDHKLNGNTTYRV